MKLCEKCNRIVTPSSVCDDAKCPVAGIQRSSGPAGPDAHADRQASAGGGRQCPNCGTGNSAKNKFCLTCGSILNSENLQAASPIAPPALMTSAEADGGEMVCAVCSRSYPPGQRFCSVDGGALTAAAASAVPSPDSAPTARPAVPEAVAPRVQDIASASLPTTGELPPVPEPETTVLASQDYLTAVTGGPICPTCGFASPPGVRFCDRDGTPLGSGPARENPRPERPVRMAKASAEPLPEFLPEADVSWDEDEDGGRFGESKSKVVPALAALGIVLAMIGGFAWWSGRLDPWLGASPDPSLAAESKSKTPLAPGLQGEYKAHISDQDISLNITGDKPRSLVTSSGTLSYLNVVNGGACTALLVPVTGGGIGGDTGNAVSFKQTPVPGKSACSKDIPVKMDITAQPVGSDGLIQSIAVEWQSPGTRKSLMSGVLRKAAGP